MNPQELYINDEKTTIQEKDIVSYVGISSVRARHIGLGKYGGSFYGCFSIERPEEGLIKHPKTNESALLNDRQESCFYEWESYFYFYVGESSSFAFDRETEKHYNLSKLIFKSLIPILATLTGFSLKPINEDGTKLEFIKK